MFFVCVSFAYYHSLRSTLNLPKRDIKAELHILTFVSQNALKQPLKCKISIAIYLTVLRTRTAFLAVSLLVLFFGFLPPYSCAVPTKPLPEFQSHATVGATSYFGSGQRLGYVASALVLLVDFVPPSSIGGSWQYCLLEIPAPPALLDLANILK